MANGRNGTRAYKKVHPNASLSTSASQANRILIKPYITQEIAARVRQDGGITREFIQGKLLHALDLAEGNPAIITTVCRELSELAGLKIIKTADVTETPSVNRKQIEDELVRRGLVTVPVN